MPPGDPERDKRAREEAAAGQRAKDEKDLQAAQKAIKEEIQRQPKQAAPPTQGAPPPPPAPAQP